MPPKSHQRSRRAVAVAAALAAATVTSGCRVDVSVGVDADDDGGGEVTATVRLDAGAVAELGGADPERAFRLDDLADAGWEVEGPTSQDDGGLEVVAAHVFDDAAEAEALVADLAGDPGLLRNVRLGRERTFFTTKTSFDGTVNLRAGLGAFADPDLQAALEATPDAPLGVSAAALERRFGAPIDRLLGIQVAVSLPGDVTTNAPTDTGSAGVWAPTLGEELVLAATSERWNVANVFAGAVSLASGLALAALLVLRRSFRTRGNIILRDGKTGTDQGATPGP